MTEKYDCTKDVWIHKNWVEAYMNRLSTNIMVRGRIHDASKLVFPEKEMYDEWTPKLKEVKFGSDEYKTALSGMGEALQHHYKHNRHHPEFHQRGIDDMNLVDVIEMVCDWMAVSKVKGIPVDMKYLAERFNVSPQLLSIIQNTMNMDFMKDA